MDGYERPATACFTGRRPQKLPWGFDEDADACADMKAGLRSAIAAAIADGYTNFWCGGALGIDMIAAEMVADMRDMGREAIRLYIAVPCAGQDRRWTEAQRGRYADILSRADKTVTLGSSYTPGCMETRNRFMANRSSRLLAVWDGIKSGGTWHTIEMSKQMGLEIIIIPTNPNT